MNRKILIIGASGFLGSSIFNLLKNKYDLLGTFNKKPIRFSKGIFFKFNGNQNNLEKKIIKFKPNLIIHTAGLTNIEKCEKNKKISKRINFELTKTLTILAKKYKIKMVYISSDHLYDGKKSSYNEIDKTNPLNFYAKTKVMSENYIKKQLNNYLIIRTNFFSFPDKNFKKNFLYFIFSNLKLKKEIRLFDDVHYSPISTVQLVKALNKLIRLKKNGIYNISSNEKISKYKFGILIANIFSLNKKLIKKTKVDNILKVTRPKNMSLNNKKLKNLGIKITSLKSQIRFIFRNQAR